MSSRDKDFSLKDVLQCSLKGLAVGVIAAAVLLFAFSGVAYCTKDPGKTAEPMGYAALVLSAAAGGIAAARSSCRSGATAVICGGSAGMMMLLLILLARLIPAEAAAEPLSGLTTALMHAAVPIASALTGLIFCKKKSRKPLRRRRR